MGKRRLLKGLEGSGILIWSISDWMGRFFFFFYFTVKQKKSDLRGVDWRIYYDIVKRIVDVVVGVVDLIVVVVVVG